MWLQFFVKLSMFSYQTIWRGNPRNPKRNVEGSVCYLSSRHLHLSTGVTQCFIEQEGMISPKDFTLLFWNYSIKRSNRQWEKTILKIRYSELFFFFFNTIHHKWAFGRNVNSEKLKCWLTKVCRSKSRRWKHSTGWSKLDWGA